MCSSLQLLCSFSNLAWKQENGCPFSAHRSARATSSVLRQQWPSESRQSYCPSSVFQPAARTNRMLLLSSEAISGYLCLRWSIWTQHNWLSLSVRVWSEGWQGWQGLHTAALLKTNTKATVLVSCFKVHQCTFEAPFFLRLSEVHPLLPLRCLSGNAGRRLSGRRCPEHCAVGMPQALESANDPRAA